MTSTMATTSPTKDGINTKKFDIDIGKEILRILLEQGHLREKELVNEITSKYGVSARTTRRIIARLDEDKEITILKKQEQEEYGIKDKDGRARYLIHKEAEQTVGLIRLAFTYIDSKQEAERKMALLELESNKYVTFSPEQINKLAECIKINDPEASYPIIRILFHQFINKKAHPENEEEFKKKIHHVIEKFYPETTLTANSKSQLISVLGVLDDPFIIKQLETDLMTQAPSDTLKGRYSSYMTANTIKKHQKDLFALQLRFTQMKQEEKAHFIQSIRDQAIQTIKAYNGEGWGDRII